MNFQPILEEIVETLRPQLGAEGKVAQYIPALARVPAAQFGIALRTCDGHEAAAGAADTAFSIQSISKRFALTLGMRALGEKLWDRIGREPSGSAFNSLVQLEFEQGTPRNLVHQRGRHRRHRSAHVQLRPQGGHARAALGPGR